MRRSTPLASRGYWPFLLPGLLAASLVIALPLGMNLYFSLTRWTGVGAPQYIGFANYGTLLHDHAFWLSFEHILAMILAMAILPTLIGLLLAALLFDFVAHRFGDRIASLLRAGFYLPQIIPIAVTGLLWDWLLNPGGAVNRLLSDVGASGLVQQNWLGDPSLALPSVMGVMIWMQLGYPIVMFMAGLQRIDPELYEAAEIDGASWWARFRHITIAMLRPEFYVVLVTTTIAALKVFTQIFVLTNGGPGDATMVPSYYSYQQFFTNANVGYGSAISTVMTVIILALAYVFLRAQARESR